jgi:hypothetical protein
LIKKRCARCGQPFPCGGYGCWCTEVPVTDWQFDWIAERYKDCLCPACLDEVRTGVLGPRSSDTEQA